MRTEKMKNHLGETDEEYTFTGLTRLVMRVHRSPDKEDRKETLRYEYDTMERLLKVKDNAASTVYTGRFEFKDGADTETEYTYDENGNLTLNSSFNNFIAKP